MSGSIQFNSRPITEPGVICKSGSQFEKPPEPMFVIAAVDWLVWFHHVRTTPQLQKSPEPEFYRSQCSRIRFCLFLGKFLFCPCFYAFEIVKSVEEPTLHGVSIKQEPRKHKLINFFSITGKSTVEIIRKQSGTDSRLQIRIDV